MANRAEQRQQGARAGDGEDAAGAVKATAVADQTFAKLLRIMRMMQSRMQQLEEAQGLSGAQMLALWQLSVNPGLRVSDLASALHLQPSSTSNMLDKLESRQLISRARNSGDQRIVTVNLTAAGWDVVRRVPGPMGGHLRQALKVLSPKLVDQLFAGISALLDALEQADATSGGKPSDT